MLTFLLLLWRDRPKSSLGHQTCLSRDALFQFLTLKISLLSVATALTHLFRDFPTGLFPMMLLYRILFDMRFSSTRWTWPTHCSLFNLIIFVMLGSSNCLHNSLLYLILHVLFSFTGLSILLNTFLSNASRADCGFLARVQLSLAYRSYHRHM
jgi:hypothetical protein